MSQSLSIDKPLSSGLKPLYVRSIVNSFGSGTVSPFLSVYAVKLGASASEMGWFQSVSNLAPNMMQVPWGRLSDKAGKRILFVVVGGLISTALWVPMMFATSATQLIFAVGVQAILGSMATPAWNALIGEIAPPSGRGRATASLSLWAAVGGLCATLLGGYLMLVTAGTLRQVFFIPFVLAIVCGVLASLAMVFAKEKPDQKKIDNNSSVGVLDWTRLIGQTPNFVRFCLATTFFGFFMSFSWPLFSITLVRVLGASMLDVAIISVIQVAVMIAFQPWMGRLVDKVGRKPLIVIDRAGLVLVPLFYAFAPSVYYLFVLSMILGVIVAMGNAAMFAYLLDVTPEEHRGSFTAFYNLVSGVVFFAGSLIGGYVSNYLEATTGTVLALQTVYLISAVGRAAGAVSFTFIKEPYKYPSTLKKELWQTMLRIPSVWERGSTQP